MFHLKTIEMPDTAGPLRLDRLILASILALSYPASANALTAAGAITAGTGFTSLPTLAPSGGTLNPNGGRAAIARATSLKVVSAALAAAGTGYVPADTITLAGGTNTTPAVLAVSTTQVVSAVVNAGGSGGTNGAVTITGTTGTGTKFQATGTIAGNALTGPLVVTVPGNYTVNPTSLAAEPVTGGSLAGATVTVVMGVLVAAVSVAGAYTVPPTNPTAQASTSGAGVGATFTTAFGLGTVAIDESGNYTAAPSFTVTPTDGNGTGASIAAGTLGGNGAPIFRQVGPFTNDGIPASFGLVAMGNGDVVCQLATKQLGYASVSIQPRLAANPVVAGSLDAILWA